MQLFKLEIIAFGKKTILINWPQRVDEAILEDIIAFTQVLQTHYGDRLVSHTPAYASLSLTLDEEVDFNAEKNEITALYSQKEEVTNVSPRHWEIPVCYEDEFGTDQETFAQKGISQRELIRLHTSGIYRVYMIGFLPGFLYLGGLPDALKMPRKATPNLKTPKNAIAIGGEQTGIYPIESPGGWHVIGRTPLSLFNLQKEVPTPIKQGDYVKFYEVDRQFYQVFS